MGKVCLAWAENVLFADLGQLRCEIMDSYQITSAYDMRRIIEALREGSLPFNAVWTRTEKSLVREWRAKNLLYSLGLFRSKTRSITFREKRSWYWIICDSVLSSLYLHRVLRVYTVRLSSRIFNRPRYEERNSGKIPKALPQ